MRYVGIDPSTKTGFVILNEQLQVLVQEEISSKQTDPARIIEIVDNIMKHLLPGDFVCIEGFGFASKAGFALGGIGWSIRMELFKRNILYREIAPSTLKKYTGAGGFADKKKLKVAIEEMWGFSHRNNNVRDAYVLARMAYDWHHQPAGKLQSEVILGLKAPKIKKTIKKRKVKIVI